MTNPLQLLATCEDESFLIQKHCKGFSYFLTKAICCGDCGITEIGLRFTRDTKRYPSFSKEGQYTISFGVCLVFD